MAHRAAVLRSNPDQYLFIHQVIRNCASATGRHQTLFVGNRAASWRVPER
jgi:hypothetical protein